MGSSATYIHPKPASFLARFIQWLLSIFRIKKSIENKLKKRQFSQEAAAIPNSLLKHNLLNLTNKKGRSIWTFEPKVNASEKVILYLHGGAYILNISRPHWSLIEELMQKTNARVVVPDYPLAPKAQFEEVYEFVESIYLDLLKVHAPQNIILMGDSAGGGLALGLAQKLKADKKAQAAQLILISPWLDITMNNPEISLVDKKDKILGIKGLQLAGEAYAGNRDAKDFRLSPIYGDFSGLGVISIFIGTHDLFIADARKMKARLEQENIPLNYFEYPKMFHDWVLFTSLIEAKEAISQIVNLIKK